MARKKSETPQGDGGHEPTPGPKDEAAGPAGAEPTPPTLPEDAAGERSEPWDPGIVPPETETGTGTGTDVTPEPVALGEPLPEALADSPATGTAPEEPAALADTDGRDGYAATEPRPAPEAEEPPVLDPEPVAVVETVEEHHEDVHEEDAGWSFAARALAVLCLLLAGAAIGIWAAPKIAPALPAGMAPVADWLRPGQTETAAEIAALREKLDADVGALDGRIAALPASADLDSRIGAAVEAAETRLSAEIAAAKADAGTVDLTAVDQRLAALEATLEGQATELGSLKEQIAGTAGQLSEEALGRIDAYKGEVEALRGEMASVRETVGTFSSRVEDVEGRAGREVEAAQARVAEIQEKADSEMTAAEAATGIASIRAAIAGGQPFAAPLAAVSSDAAPAPAGLSDAAESGVATLAQLRESYPDAAHAAIRASVMASSGSGVLARSRAFLEAQISSRSLTPRTGQGTDAVLSRMEDRLRQDDLDGVLAEAGNLPSEAAAAMGDWLAAARKRAAAVDGLATLDATFNKTN